MKPKVQNNICCKDKQKCNWNLQVRLVGESSEEEKIVLVVLIQNKSHFLVSIIFHGGPQICRRYLKLCKPRAKKHTAYIDQPRNGLGLGAAQFFSGKV